MNRCTLFIVDALDYSSLQKWIDRGALPNLAQLIERGGKLKPCTSIFPSITPAATCSIATGRFPKDHGIQGACWHDLAANESPYFGSDLRMIWQAGIQDYVSEFADDLNGRHLRQPLVFEQLAARGIDSACINFMWYRGPYSHQRQTPWPIKAMAGDLKPTVHGPRYLKLGDFVHALPAGLESPEGMVGGLMGRYGFHDDTTAACMLAMARSESLPPFSLGYFPLNDDEAHQYGLDEAAKKRLTKFDEFLGEYVEALGGWQIVKNYHDLIIVGDHGQSESESNESLQHVPLHQILSEYSQAVSLAGFESNDEVLICPNMRASAIYLRDEVDNNRHKIVETLLSDSRVDQVIYRNFNEDGFVTFTIKTAKRGQMTFRRSVAGHSVWKPNGRDVYGNRWSIVGETSCLDLSFDHHRCIVEGKYPNALERIEGAFTGGRSPIWVTAIPGAEFQIAETSGNRAGSHGSLHESDSVAAIVGSAGIKWSRLASTDQFRLVDVLPLVLSSLGILHENAQMPSTNHLLAGSPVLA